VAGNGVMILAEKKIFILAGKYIAGYIFVVAQHEISVYYYCVNKEGNDDKKYHFKRGRNPD